MNPTSFTLVIVGVLLNASAQLLLKAGTNAIGAFEFSGKNILPIGWRVASEPHILAGLSAYVVSVGTWILALSRVEVSVAYPMLSIGYVVNAVAARYLFGEMLSLTRMAGIAVVIFGVYLIARS
jgi:multidrug transporter EmrE-like cation transporter